MTVNTTNRDYTASTCYHKEETTKEGEEREEGEEEEGYKRKKEGRGTATTRHLLISGLRESRLQGETRCRALRIEDVHGKSQKSNGM